MSKIRFFIKSLLLIVYGGFSSIYMPSFLNVVFNFTHGVANNPDGTISIPFGIIILLVILTIDILIILKTFKSNNMTKLEKAIIFLLFITIKFIGLTVDKNGWSNFIDCFKWKFMQ